jgi:outer membrane protein assembly factor BamD
MSRSINIVGNHVAGILLLLLLVTVSSCSKYQKVLKSTDLSFKYDKAVEYYNDGEYYRAEALFGELIGLYRGMGKAEEIYYYYAYCNYYMEDFIMAGYYFDNFVNTYPTSKYAEECMYLTAYCYYLNSPESSLDQTSTVRAIEEMQLFINRYPKSERVKGCNELIDVLRGKLEKKAFDNASLYHHLTSYKAAIVAFNNLIVDFPDTKYKEEAYFYILKANYSLAVNSIEAKKKERLDNTLDAYYDYENYQPTLSGLGEDQVSKGAQSKFAKEAENIHGNTLKGIENLTKQLN